MISACGHYLKVIYFLCWEDLLPLQSVLENLKYLYFESKNSWTQNSRNFKLSTGWSWFWLRANVYFKEVQLLTSGIPGIHHPAVHHLDFCPSISFLGGRPVIKVFRWLSVRLSMSFVPFWEHSTHIHYTVNHTTENKSGGRHTISALNATNKTTHNQTSNNGGHITY